MNFLLALSQTGTADSRWSGEPLSAEEWAEVFDRQMEQVPQHIRDVVTWRSWLEDGHVRFEVVPKKYDDPEKTARAIEILREIDVIDCFEPV